MNSFNHHPVLSVIISALNEEARVEAILRQVLEIFKKYDIDGELIFLNNHSADRTGDIAAALAKTEPRLKVIQRYNRSSKDLGSSLKEGIKNAAGNFFLIMDCDLSHNPEDIRQLFDSREKADIIIGSRFVKGGSATLSSQRRFLSRFYNVFARVLTGLPVNDLTTGFKLYRLKKVTDIKIENNGFGFHVELPIKAYFRGATFLEIPIHYENSPKESTLLYHNQFFSYINPVFWGFLQRIKHIFSVF